MKSFRNFLLLTVLCVCLPTMSYGTSLQYIQDGWSFGPLTMSFTGEDADLDGWIEQSELTAFKAVYGLTEGSSTMWLLHDLEPAGFFFSDPGNFLIFARNPEYSLVDIGFEGEILGSVFDQFLFPFDETQASPTPTPEPTGMALAGLLTIGGLMFQKTRQKSVQHSAMSRSTDR